MSAQPPKEYKSIHINQIRNISIYLSGQYPKHYVLPDRLRFIRAVKKVYNNKDLKELLELIPKEYPELAFYNAIMLQVSVTRRSDKLYKIIEYLKIPEEVYMNKL